MFGINVLYIIGGLILIRLFLKRLGLIDNTKEGNLRAQDAGMEGKMGSGLSMDISKTDE